MGQILSDQAAKSPRGVAVKEEDGLGRVRSYAEVDHRATQLANWLLALQPERQARVAVMLPNGADYVEALFGIARAGHVSVHVNTKLTVDEVAYQLADSGAHVFIVGGDFVEASPGLAELVPPAQLIVCDSAAGAGSTYERGLATASPVAPRLLVAADDPFFIGYTSGTTGRPKGAVISHRSRVLSALVCSLEYGLSHRDRQLMMTPMYHGGPMIFLLMSVLTGHPLYTLDGFQADRVTEAVERLDITTMFVVPTILKRLLDSGVTPQHMSSIRSVVSNAAALPTAVKERFLQQLPGTRLWEAYGSTEASWVSNLGPEDQARKVECCGLPLPLVEVGLFGEDGQPVPTGEVGELYARGPLVFDGYLNRPEANAEAFRSDGFMTVGDLARRDEEKFLYIVDRKKDMIISGGVNIYPREVEEVLIQHPGISDAAVYGEPDPEWGEQVVAAVAAERGVTQEILDDYCRGHLASFKRPRRYVFVDAIPRSVTGKALKTQLRARAVVR